MLHPELAREYEALQDRLRDHIFLTWQSGLNARRGHGGLIREDIARLEVVEMQHRRSCALDLHIHRHLWLNVKVQGADGKWLNLDSRVAMRMQTLINAEGELAARADPAWISALARHVLSLDESGEIRSLAAVVRPLLRRSAQIETNRAALIAQWRTANPGGEPSRDILAQIDRRLGALATRQTTRPRRGRMGVSRSRRARRNRSLAQCSSPSDLQLVFRHQRGRRRDARRPGGE